MYLLGLTGSVGMGKTTAADVFRRYGAAVYDADATVHHLMGSGGSALGLVKRAFPDVVKNNSIDRKALGLIVYNDKKALAELELHFTSIGARRYRRGFCVNVQSLEKNLLFLDIPLLFEKKIDRYFDSVAVVTAPKYVQELRVLQRPEMTPERFNQIVAHQCSDLEKRKRADFIIQTGLGRRYSLSCIHKIIKLTQNYRGLCWPPQRVNSYA